MGKDVLNWVNNIYIKATVNIKLNGEKLETFPLRSKVSKSTIAFQHCTGMLANAMKQEKKIQKGLEKFKLQWKKFFKVNLC